VGRPLGTSQRDYAGQLLASATAAERPLSYPPPSQRPVDHSRPGFVIRWQKATA